ncbi:unnamed protein product [Rotaria socialis]
MDGTPNCYNAFDESIAANSCVLNNKYRFHCTSESKCLSLAMVRDGTSQCIGNEDETYSSEQIAFQAKQLKNIDRLHSKQEWFCHRGILIYYGKNESDKRLGPPSYYDSRCQYQNQRASLSLRFRNENLNKLDIIGMIITLIDNAGLIQSHEQVTYIPIHDCNTKINIYLLYRDRPKDTTKNYTIRIDAYDKINLLYLTSWTLPVKFIFMPVNRVSAELIIPARYYCHRVGNLKHREQQKLANSEFCRCESKNSQATFLDRTKCN